MVYLACDNFYLFLQAWYIFLGHLQQYPEENLFSLFIVKH